MSARSILVVEDDEDLREAVMLVLDRYGYEMRGAHDGIDAIEQIRAHGRPDMILLDLRMPRMNGEELAHAIRQDPALAPAPIVVLSGDSTARDVAASIGARGVLAKPVDLDVLVKMVRDVLPDGHHE